MIQFMQKAVNLLPAGLRSVTTAEKLLRSADNPEPHSLSLLHTTETDDKRDDFALRQSGYYLTVRTACSRELSVNFSRNNNHSTV